MPCVIKTNFFHRANQTREQKDADVLRRFNKRAAAKEEREAKRLAQTDEDFISNLINKLVFDVPNQSYQQSKERQKRWRNSLTSEKKSKINEAQNERQKKLLLNETPHEKEYRLKRAREYQRKKSKALSDPVDKWIERRENEMKEHGHYVNPRYIDKAEEAAVEKYFDIRDQNKEKIADWRATIPDEKYKAYMDADADRKRKERASNMTEKQHENFQQ